MAAIGATLPGAAWQCCRTHYTVNLMSVCPEGILALGPQPAPFTVDQADPESFAAQYDRVLDTLTENLPKHADDLDTTRANLLPLTTFPNRSGATIPRKG